MGAACCIIAQDKAIPNKIVGETGHRNVLYSPSWSFQWENRGRVAGETENSSLYSSQGNRRNASLESKGEISSVRSNISDGESLLENFGTPTSQKSPLHEGRAALSMNTPSDISISSTYSTEVKNYRGSSEITEVSVQKLSFPTHSSFSLTTTVPSPSQPHPRPPYSTPSRRARRSPGHQLFRQVSDSRILGLKSPNNYSMSERRPSFVLSTGSHGGSSDGWSMRTFSELVASSQRERWSFDSGRFGSEQTKNSGSSSRFPYSPSQDLQTCAACLKLLTERSSWKYLELSVTAVLVCGHVYHAECLEAMTTETDMYDPACPTCTGRQKQVSKMSTKSRKAEAELKGRDNKISKNRVVDSYFDDHFDVLDRRKLMEQKGKFGKTEASSSRPPKSFLKQHFSFGSNWSRSLSENHSARKKGFWAKYRKD